MFLNFGKKSSSIKKPATQAESPKPVSALRGTSPAIPANAGSRSTVQTTAGPLLSSSRFNSILDASTYANVNSPGFTSRVVNCASGGSTSHNGNSEIHPSKYSSVGLFPSVQLRGLTILPTLSPRNSQKVRTPVRVRIAPPSCIDHRHHTISATAEVKGKTELLKESPTSTHLNQNKETSTSAKVSDNGPSVPDVIQEASRKRIFSECQDASLDEAKKRRKKVELPIPNPNDDTYHYRHVRVPAVPSSAPQLDLSSQGKRAREKGSPEEQKRQRRKVCNTNNAIFSSLSSSRNLLERLTAQKRKSVDTSRSSSPLTPLIGKQVKESKTVTNAKAVQCNLVDVPQHNLEKLDQHDGTPVSSKAIIKRLSTNVKESPQNLIKTPGESHQASPCDYTTKLFRKEVSHTPRTPTSKTPKQSLWVQAPEADELTCSLLSDDSKLHRPERLRSLLACVSGKDNKTEGVSTVAVQPTTTASVSASLPVSSGQKLSSPVVSLSSALTVTVSSTCTIMTSATVTSVNGVPSSESGRSPPPPVSLSTSSFSLSSQGGLSISSTSVQSPIKVPASLPQTTGSTLCGANLAQAASVSAGVLPTVPLAQTTASSFGIGISSPSVAPSAGFSANGLGAPTSNNSTEGIKTTFNAKSPLNSSRSSGIATSVEVSKPAFQLTSGSSNPTASNSMFQFGSNVQTPKAIAAASSIVASSTSSLPVTANSAVQFTPGQTSLAPSSNPSLGTSATKPTFSFGSSGTATSGDPKPAFQFNGATTSTGTDQAASLKPAFSFGSSSSGSANASKPAFQFNSSQSAISDTAKTAQFSSGPSSIGVTGTSQTTFSFGPSGAISNTSEPPKPALQFGSVGNSISSAPQSTFQFGSAASSINSPSAPKPTPQFGSTPAITSVPSEAPKSTFQFGSSGSGSNGTSNVTKSAFEFGSSTNSPAMPSKPAFQFSSQTQPAPSFGSSNSGLASGAKSAFQFAASPSGPTSGNSAFQFSSTTGNSADASKSPFQFASSVNKPTDLSNSAFGSTTQGSNSAFGQVAPQQPKASFSFGSATNQTTNGTSGSQSNSAFSFGSSGSVFGATNSSSSFGAPATNTQAAVLPFGAPVANAQAAVPSFGAPVANAQAAVPSFGAPVANTQAAVPSFGAAVSTFGAPVANTQASVPSFGSPATNSKSAVPSFGTTTDTKSNGFGSTLSFGSTGSGSGSFSFGSNSSSGSANSFQSSGISSGGSSGAFSFGQNQNQNQANAALGFNASITAIPNPAPGLFSVGAGSAPSQRRPREARRRR